MENVAIPNNTLALGGIGAGFLRLDTIGQFSGHIPATGMQSVSLRNSTLCLRLRTASGKTYVRALNDGGTPDKKPHDGGDAPACLPPNLFQHCFNYPTASFHLNDPESPVALTWTCFSPVIPYDHIAAAMPVVMVRVRVHNTQPEACETTVMLTFDNIVGVSEPVGSANTLMHAVHVSCSSEDDGHFLTGDARRKQTDTTTMASQNANGLIFGERRTTTGEESRPHACLAARESGAAKIAVSCCNPGDPIESKRFWRLFSTEGKPPYIPVTTVATLGAVSISMPLAPQAIHHFDFAFAWHVPQGCDETGRFNSAYSYFFKSAQDTVQYALRNFEYMITAVEKWQQRLLSPRLPSNFGCAVLNSGSAFTTHARHARKGGLVFLHDSSPPGNTRVQPWEFLRAMALLAFAPHFHTVSVTRELQDLLDIVSKADFTETPEFLRTLAMLILSSYADILLLSHRARMAEWLPLIRKTIKLSIHATSDTLPLEETVLERFSPENTGLWAAAWEAVACMARETDNLEEEARFRRMSALFYKQYQSCLQKHRRQEAGADKTVPNLLKNMNVLAGPCFSRILGLEPPPAVRDLVTVLTDDAGIVGVTDSHLSVLARAVGVLARLLYQGERGCSIPELRVLFKSLYDPGIGSSQDRPAQALLPGPDLLACWAVLQAAAGFTYDALHQTVTLRFPQEFVFLQKYPILCPLSLGIIIVKRFKEEEGLILLRFFMETPLTIKSIFLHLPRPTVLETISCIRNGETLAVRHESAAKNNDTLINLTFKPVQKMVNTFTLRLRELPENQKERRS